jgi:hypothetical protein
VGKGGRGEQRTYDTLGDALAVKVGKEIDMVEVWGGTLRGMNYEERPTYLGVRVAHGYLPSERRMARRRGHRLRWCT